MNDAECLLVTLLHAHEKDDVSAIEFGDPETEVFGGATGTEAFARFGESGSAVGRAELLAELLAKILHRRAAKSFLFVE
jgi:hypothetical protein